MNSTPIVSGKKVAIIGPKFGIASQAIDEAVRSFVGQENVESFWYEESRFERKIGRTLGRLVRVFFQAAPLSHKSRAAVERFVGAIRFRRSCAAESQLDWAGSIGTADQLILVKPMFLRSADLQRVRESLQAKAVSIVLWDALWRTPTITKLMPHSQVFSTEPTDCHAYGMTLLHVPSAESELGSENHDSRSNQSATASSHHDYSPAIDRPTRLFFCGSWSLDRWLNARRLISAIRYLERDSAGTLQEGPKKERFSCEIHLVTSGRATSWLTQKSGIATRPLSVVCYDRGVAQCDVLLDLGRTGQSSPSERLAKGMRHSRIVISVNPHLKTVGFPLLNVDLDGWNSVLLRAEEALAKNDPIAQCWRTNYAAQSFITTKREWVQKVLAFDNGAEIQRSGGLSVCTS
jgi:hypothetical protein